MDIIIRIKVLSLGLHKNGFPENETIERYVLKSELMMVEIIVSAAARFHPFRNQNNSEFRCSPNRLAFALCVNLALCPSVCLSMSLFISLPLSVSVSLSIIMHSVILAISRVE